MISAVKIKTDSNSFFHSSSEGGGGVIAPENALKNVLQKFEKRTAPYLVFNFDTFELPPSENFYLLIDFDLWASKNLARIVLVCCCKSQTKESISINQHC